VILSIGACLGREFTFLKNLLPRALRIQDGTIVQRTYRRVITHARQHIELFVRPIVFAGEAEQLKQKHSVLNMRRIVAKDGA
jgi:hypothetical protein